MKKLPSSPDTSPIVEPAWFVVGCFALLLIGVYLTAGYRIRISEWHVRPESNAALEEALQWQKGRLSLEQNDYEVARVGDRRYNVVGLAFVLISLVGTSLTKLGGGPPGTMFAAHYIMLVALPLPIVAFAAFRSLTRSSVWGAVLAGNLIIATSLLPILAGCRGGQHGASIYYINHVLAVTGLLLLAADMLGPRRVWPSIIGLALAAWSRQMTCLYAIPILWLAFTDRPSEGRRRAASFLASLHPPRAWLALSGVIVIAAVPMTLNYLKFGNPFETGYGRMYEGREDPIGRSGREELLSTKYLGHNAVAMNFAFPSWDLRQGSIHPDTSDMDGGSIWLTTPILLGVIVTANRWWQDRARRILMLASFAVAFGVLMYHTTGAQGSGHFRYGLDFIPIWLAAIAPYAVSPRGFPWTLGCMGYSALYFSLLP